MVATEHALKINQPSGSELNHHVIPNADRRLNLLYVHDGSIGYGRLGVCLADTLHGMGISVEDDLTPDTEDPAPAACWVSTPSHAQGWFGNQTTHIFTMWEAMRLPESFHENLHNFNTVIVPSDQNVELFSRYHSNVKKVPLGIDTRRWHFKERQDPAERFVFLIGGSGARKGVDLAYKAFRKLWGQPGSWPRESPRPTLIFKSPRPVDYFGERIEHVGGRIPPEQEVALYEMAHCYLQPSRGEGFGLQPLQAIAQGIPTILTDAHGHKDFAHLGYPLGYTMTKSEYFIYGDAGDWWEPSLDDLCDWMKFIYDHYDEARNFAYRSAAVVKQDFTWGLAGRRFVNAIGEENLTLYNPRSPWVKPVQRLFPVRTTKPHRISHCQTVYQFHPGKTYWEPADIKRILFEANMLDPSCIVDASGIFDGPPTENETGLAPEQLAHLDAYSACHEACWDCGQILNSGRYPEYPDE